MANKVRIPGRHHRQLWADRERYNMTMFSKASMTGGTWRLDFGAWNSHHEHLDQAEAQSRVAT